MNTFRFCPLTLLSCTATQLDAKNREPRVLQSAAVWIRPAEWGMTETGEAAGSLTSSHQDWTIVLVPW